MTGTKKYVAATVVAAALLGLPTVSYAVAQGTTAHDTAPPSAVTLGTVTPAGAASSAKAPTPRIVAPGQRVRLSDGSRIWLSPEGKHWTTPDDPDPQFRSVVDGNIDLGTPGVSLQAQGLEDHYLLSGLYYGGKGTASRVTVHTTTAGAVQGRLLELPGSPGWGVWYAIAALPKGGGEDGPEFHDVVVRDTEGRVYARLGLD
ncbi:hypothetical protein AB0912_28940 [Streptomyces sp. NPDC007084]|uniref:hypothetical protein n=1 Tax=Streptomyces sp. NPDC007084 TaxID=3154313 RepID=UPI003456EBE1